MDKVTDEARWHGLWWEWALLTGITAAIIAGAGFRLSGHVGSADIAWIVATAAGLLPAIAWLAVSLMRRRIGVDVIAVLALAGTLGVHQYGAGALVALLLVLGAALETYARHWASGDLQALLNRVPRTARRHTGEGGEEMVDSDAIRPDDRLIVYHGEVVPVDGFAEESAVLDEFAITGEREPVERSSGERVASGAVNAGEAFGMRATTTAARSTYASIVRLARQATGQRAPMVRLADRYAIVFVPFTLLLAGLAWAVGGVFVRAVAVLVVATPGPLIFAAPIAIVCGLSRSARSGVMVRDGAVLERLGRAGTVLVDKSGTLSLGRPKATEMVSAPDVDDDETLRLAASVEQFSSHPLASAVVAEAARRGLSLAAPEDVHEENGRGISGRVDGRTVWVGQLDGELAPWAQQERNRAELDGAAVVWVSLDNKPAGALLVQDPVRSDARRNVRGLREAGVSRLVMVTGDRPQIAAEMARMVGVDDVIAQCSEEEKVQRVRAESQYAVTVMVGDGVQDGPALSAAHVGVALGATGASASAEAADAVLTVDRLDKLGDAVEIARHSRRIALGTAAAGMLLVVAAMAIAMTGLLVPVAGALVREGIEVVVIAGALSALIGGVRRHRLPTSTDELIDQFTVEHERLRDALIRLRSTADLVAMEHDGAMCVDRLRDAYKRLSRQLISHDEAEERRLYPELAGPVGPDTTATMSRAHTEIRRLVDRVDGHLCLTSDSRLEADQVPDLLATLYGLDAILRLHFAEEEENLFSLTSASNPIAVGQ
ncbi:MAG TPA: heavy metal translocating P-type ATPase [Rugosimonospora sp.]|jgi:heavy metal translocating P-type ATPase